MAPGRAGRSTDRYFGGWEIYHLTGSPVDPDRLYASQSTGWFGQVIQRSDDGGATWAPVGNQFATQAYPEPTSGTTEHRTRGSSAGCGTSNRLSPTSTPSTRASRTRHCSAQSTAAGSGRSSPGSATTARGAGWQPGAGGMCLHTIVLDPRGEDRMFAAISAAGVFRTDDAGRSWKPANHGLHSEQIPDPDAEVGHCVHRIAMHPSHPDVLFMQKHWDVMRSDDGGDSWYEISGNLPSDFGFPIAVHAHEPDTVYVVPITSDESTTHRRRSCASTAAAPAATNGNR